MATASSNPLLTRRVTVAGWLKERWTLGFGSSWRDVPEQLNGKADYRKMLMAGWLDAVKRVKADLALQEGDEVWEWQHVTHGLQGCGGLAVVRNGEVVRLKNMWVA